jgi:hypothetical protein
MKIKTAGGRQLVFNELSPSGFEIGSVVVVIKLRQSSKYYHPFLAEFTTKVLSATDKQITIKSPVKASKEKEWTIHINDIEDMRVN